MNFRSIASVTPSSRWMAAAMVSDIDFERAKCIVELGAGTGPVTAELVRRVRPGCRLIVVERDPDFCAILLQRFPHVEIVQADAVNIDAILVKRGVTAIDHIVCCLGLPGLPASVRSSVFAMAKAYLIPGGSFVQLTEWPLLFYHFYRKHFAKVRFSLVLLNFPPGGFYRCFDPYGN